LIAGCGYVGGRLAELLVEDGVEVWGMRRGGSGLPPGVHALEADVTDPGTLGRVPAELDAVVYAVSPDDRSEAAYRAAYVRGPRNVVGAAAEAGGFGGRAILVGSTGVYGFTDGRRVDEDTPPEPADPTAERLLEGEELVRSLGSPGVALRLGGIYGPGRTSTLRRVVEGRARCPGRDKYGNRIHRDDAAGALRHLLGLPDPRPVYLGVDRDPASLRDVYRWMAERAGAPDPCGRDEDETWEARGRRGTSKRCSSDRLVASGYRFLYPTFREGYGALLSAR
jgi:nucleoside-diphosphate-sugar epimerase